MQVDAKEAEASDKRARRAEVVTRLAAATHVYVPCNTAQMTLLRFFASCNLVKLKTEEGIGQSKLRNAVLFIPLSLHFFKSCTNYYYLPLQCGSIKAKFYC